MKFINFDSMNSQDIKLDLIQWLVELKDQKVLDKIQKLKKSQDDWWNEISDEEKVDIRAAMKEADEDDFIPHEKVMTNPRKWA